jgi:hypothetical protein
MPGDSGAGPITTVADLVIPTPFTNYTQQRTELKSNLVRSGVLRRDPQMQQFLANMMQVPGGVMINMPSLQDLARTAARVSTDTAHAEFGGAAEPTPDKIGSTFESFPRLMRNMSWSDADLARILSGINPLAAVQNLVGDYWVDELQSTFIAITKGLCLDNEASPTGTDKHAQNDLLYDASGSSFVKGVTNFNAAGVVRACGTLGDSMDKIQLVCMHSVVYQTALINNLIITRQDSELGEIRTFFGKEVIVDDSMPNPSPGVYETWLFQRGFMGWGEAALPGPNGNTEVDRKAGAGNGGGQTVLYSRRCWGLHPYGHRFIGTPANGGPSNASTSNNFGHADSWSRVVNERKMIGFARYITREFAA